MTYLDLAVRQNGKINYSKILEDKKGAIYLGKRLRRSYSDDSISEIKKARLDARKHMRDWGSDFLPRKCPRYSCDKRSRDYLVSESQRKAIKLQGESRFRETKEIALTKNELIIVSFLLDEHKIDWEHLATELGLKKDYIASLKGVSLFNTPSMRNLSMLSTWFHGFSKDTNFDSPTIHSLKTAICSTSESETDKDIKELLDKLDSISL